MGVLFSMLHFGTTLWPQQPAIPTDPADLQVYGEPNQNSDLPEDWQWWRLKHTEPPENSEEMRKAKMRYFDPIQARDVADERIDSLIQKQLLDEMLQQPDSLILLVFGSLALLRTPANAHMFLMLIEKQEFEKPEAILFCSFFQSNQTYLIKGYDNRMRLAHYLEAKPMLISIRPLFADNDQKALISRDALAKWDWWCSPTEAGQNSLGDREYVAIDNDAANCLIQEKLSEELIKSSNWFLLAHGSSAVMRTPLDSGLVLWTNKQKNKLKETFLEELEKNRFDAEKPATVYLIKNFTGYMTLVHPNDIFILQ